ncbi:MAG: hypothetical protein ACLFQW_09085 [Spirochaetaceae bacterium]
MEHDRALADLYIGYAVDLFERGAMERADDFAETALLFNPESPDALFIRGEAARSDSRLGEAADFYSKAILDDTWNRFEPMEAVTSLAALHYRTGKSDEAYLLLYPYYSKIFDNLEQALLYTKILVKLDFPERALRAVRTASGRFPQNEELQKLRIRLDSSYRERAKELIREGDSQELFTKEAYRGVISRIPETKSIDASQKAADAEELLAMYENRWGEDRFSHVYKTWTEAVKLQEGESIEPLSAELFSTYDTFTGSEFELLCSASENGTYDMSGFTSFSGKITYDDNKDGYTEKRIEYTDGKIENMVWDRDQDSRPEVKVRFSGGEPVRVEIGQSGAAEGYYGRYPNLVKAVYLSNGEGEFILNLIPYEIDFTIFEDKEWDELNPPHLLEEVSFPRIDELLFYASKIERSSGERVHRYSSQDGKSEMHSVSTPERSVTGQYEGASLTRRKRVFDGEEGMEITEAYEKGELAYISYDGTGDGRSEYMEIYKEEEIIRLWDIDEDGVFDYEMRVERENREKTRETE